MPFPEVFDSSIVNDLKDCPAKFDLAHCEDWKHRGISVHLHAGGAFAKGCEVTRSAFYLGEYDKYFPAEQSIDRDTGELVVRQPPRWQRVTCDPGNRELAIEVGVGALLASYGDYEAPDHGSGSAKTAERMAGALIYYWDNYPLNHETAFPIMLPGNERGIEFNFVHPLPIAHPETGNPLLYTGRLDAVLNYAGGHWGFDEKTTTSLGASWASKWNLRGQFIGYTWGCREAGIPIAGVVVRGVSILKTKYDNMESINYYPDWMVNQWYVELLEWLEDAIVAYKRKRFRHNYGEACTNYGGCAFRKICDESDQRPWLETHFERRHWDPVLRTETLVLSDKQLAEST